MTNDSDDGWMLMSVVYC